jgi:hypothetical protein
MCCQARPSFCSQTPHGGISLCYFTHRHKERKTQSQGLPLSSQRCAPSPSRTLCSVGSELSWQASCSSPACSSYGSTPTATPSHSAMPGAVPGMHHSRLPSLLCLLSVRQHQLCPHQHDLVLLWCRLRARRRDRRELAHGGARVLRFRDARRDARARECGDCAPRGCCRLKIRWLSTRPVRQLGGDVVGVAIQYAPR